MAISPPSDIVMDVVRAAEPASVTAARAKLARLGGPAVTDAVFVAPEAPGPVPSTGAAVKEEATSGAYRKFEALVLNSFIRSMLPEGAESVYGDGLSGDMWKSLMAQELGASMAERGGIGIADRLLADHYMDGEKTIPVGNLTDPDLHAETDSQNRLSVALVQEFERKLASSVFGDQAHTANDNDG